MSSGGFGAGLGRTPMILPHAAEDLVRDTSTECTDGFLLGVAGSPSMLEVIVAASSGSDLSDSDAMQSRVQLTIATAVEAMTFGRSRPDRDRSAPVMHGKPSRRLKSANARGLANQLGRAECCTAV